MNPLRILVLAPGSNPDSISTALVGYAHSEALARLHAVTLVANGCHEAPLRRKPTPFLAIELISTPWLDRIYSWIIQYVFKGDYGSQLLTALSYPSSLVFEWKAWRLLRCRIMAGEFDVVLRLLPVVPTLPSLFAFFLRRGPIPFVIGPINGGLPWPQGFSQAEKQKEWISSLRNLYRILPFAKSAYRYAAAIIAGSSQTYSEFAAYREKIFFVPENGLSRSLLDSALCKPPSHDRLELIYVGRLVPYKACDLAVRAAAPLLQKGLARLTIVGDGPERQGLEQLAKSLGIEKVVIFCGWLNHSEAMPRLQQADVLVFPSIREFGGGVVFEALALGVVPVVVDYGGPGDIVHPGVGYKVGLTNEQDMVAEIEKILMSLAGDRSLLAQLQEQGMHYAQESLSWDGKARVVTEILQWAVEQGPKPNLPSPKALPQQGW
jgi:glycosyltransferase involved in cell wall biosynthesis